MQILREEGYDKDGGKEAGGKGGVVHSFTGTPDEANELVGSPMRSTDFTSTSSSLLYDRWTWVST